MKNKNKIKRDTIERKLDENRSTMAARRERKTKRRSDTSSDEESMSSDEDRGQKPPAAATAAESAQQKLDRTWKETANAFDCANRLKEELDKAEELTRKHRQALKQERAKQENTQKLIKRQKTEESKDDGGTDSGKH